MPENHNGRCKNITVMKLLQTGADSIGACNDRKNPLLPAQGNALYTNKSRNCAIIDRNNTRNMENNSVLLIYVIL